MDPAPLRPYEVTWEDWLLGGGARASFPDPDLPLEVEIGPGEDAFLLESALERPDRNWLGIEYSRKRVRKYVRRIEREGARLTNLRLIWRPAGDLVGPFLSPAMVQAYHIYFPDPWPKAHHARYRIMAPAFVRALEGSLVRGGHVHLATDAQAYVAEIREVFAEVRDMVEEPVDQASFDDLGVTVFEERWRALGRMIHFVRFRRTDAHH